jgi:RNA polymerase sigma-70 factor (ECF subfamily)
VSLGAVQVPVAPPPARTLQAEVEELCERHAGMVYRISRRYARDESEADDIAQEVWGRVIALLPHRNPNAPIERWLARVAINVARETRTSWFRFDRMRARLRRLFGMERPAGAGFEEPSSEWVMREVAEQVWSLPPLQKEVVLRRIYDGLSLAETAAELDVAEGTVKASLHRANQKLAKKLEPLRELWERDEI